MGYIAKYRAACISVSLLFISLAFTLAFRPELIYWLFELQGNAASDVLSMRAGMLFLGLSFLAWSGRNAPTKEFRQCIARVMQVLFIALICAGIYELYKGTVGHGIWIAVAGEAVFLALFSHLYITEP